jgi:hypothetical protein
MQITSRAVRPSARPSARRSAGPPAIKSGDGDNALGSNRCRPSDFAYAVHSIPRSMVDRVLACMQTKDAARGRPSSGVARVLDRTRSMLKHRNRNLSRFSARSRQARFTYVSGQTWVLKYDLRSKPCSFAATEPGRAGEPWRGSAFLLETRVKTARAVAGCWPVTLSLAAKQDVQRCVKIAQDLGSSSGRVFLRSRCEETTCSRLRRRWCDLPTSAGFPGIFPVHRRCPRDGQ